MSRISVAAPTMADILRDLEEAQDRSRLASVVKRDGWLEGRLRLYQTGDFLRREDKNAVDGDIVIDS